MSGRLRRSCSIGSTQSFTSRSIRVLRVCNAKCERYFTIADDGLRKHWDGERVFMNPAIWPSDRRLGEEGIRSQSIGRLPAASSNRHEVVA